MRKLFLRSSAIASVVAFGETGAPVNPEIIRYLNRLSDLVWLFGRLIEFNAGINARLREEKRNWKQILTAMNRVLGEEF